VKIVTETDSEHSYVLNIFCKITIAIMAIVRNFDIIRTSGHIFHNWDLYLNNRVFASIK
jgi:hypothetical protein